MDRVYYTERIVQITFGTAILGTALDLMFLNKGYFVERSRYRLPRYWIFATAISSFSAFVLLKPLTKDEIWNQWQKRVNMGKYLSSLYHLEDVYAKYSDKKE